MKNILYFILIFLLFGCELTGLKTSCDEELEFTPQELVWGKEKDSILYLNSENSDTVKVILQSAGRDKDDSYCPKVDVKDVAYKPLNNNKLSRVSFHLKKSEKYGSNILFKFNSSESSSQINLIGNSQDMGYIDIAKNEPIDVSSIDYTQTTKLGTHELNGEIYNNVFLIEDLKKSEVPEIDIFRFYVNPSGILRIEFYDGEIWDRID